MNNRKIIDCAKFREERMLQNIVFGSENCISKYIYKSTNELEAKWVIGFL